MEPLDEKVTRLETLYYGVLDAAIEEKDVDKAHNLLKEYQQVRQDIRLSLLPNPVASLPEITDPEILERLQLISSGQDLPNDFIRGLFQDTLDPESLEKLSVELFYTKFNPYDYIESLYEVGSIVVGAGPVPKHLQSLVDEMRQCFVLNQYHATLALCRTVLEISVRDVFEREGLTDPHSDNYIYVEKRISHSARRRFLDNPDPPLQQMIGMLCLLRGYRHLKTPLRQIAGRGNEIIHGFRPVTREETEQTVREVLQAVHDLYQV